MLTRNTLRYGIAPIALLLAGPAAAQQPAAVEEIVVTGTRVVRDGYEAPTPLTVMSVDQIQDSAPANVADFVNELPQLTGSTTPQGGRTSISAGGTGINALNLRNLGTTRVLVLLDGKRNVGSQPTGQVDVNTFPQQLISRVDVVTGGASAAYGSDALAGVVNFVLDKRFTGIKGEVQGGVSTYGDDRNWNVSLAAGTPFASERGHFLISGEASKIDGIFGCPRDWCEQGWNIINNPDYAPGSGLPERLVLSQTAPSNQTPGGIITAGPLAGIAFGPGGEPYQFNYGALRRDPWMQGGEWRANDVHQDISLDPSASRQNAFARLSYEVTDDIEVFAEWSWAFNKSRTVTATHFSPGNITIQGDNAFIPDEIRTQMQTLGLTTLQMGSYSSDLEPIQGENERTVRRYVAGATGNFDIFDSRWNWDVYYQYGKAGARKSFYDRIRTPFNNAIDAVRDSNGAIVCRTTLTDPGNGCVPWNVFGTGVNSQSAIDYVADWSYAFETNKQEVIAGTVTGEPLSTWAGPVSLALGVEHRKESGGGIESAINAANQSWVGNQAPTFGSYSVTEGFVETVVPLANDLPWAKSLEFNGAVRMTSYSTSGYVTTWKAGATYSPVDDITFRATRSRDIRAPHRQELFAAGIFTGNVIVDPFRGNVLTDVQSLLSGNINLNPEKADTTGVGAIYQPSWAPGLSASVDFYNIKINNAIGTVGRQETVDRCFRGEQIFCDNLEYDANNVISIVKIQPTNFVKQIARGLDIEASYDMPLDNLVSNWQGDLTFRVLATRYLKNYEDTGSSPPTDTVGANGGSGPPKWRYRLSATYTNDPVRVTLTGRGISAGVYANTNIECTTSCPDSSSLNRTVNDNHVPGALYLDAALTYKILDIDQDGAGVDAYLNVRNLMNKDPALVAQGPGGVAFSTPPSNPLYYDSLGRMFRAGVRFRM